MAAIGPSVPHGPRNFASAAMIVCEMFSIPPPDLSANANTTALAIAMTEP